MKTLKKNNSNLNSNTNTCKSFLTKQLLPSQFPKLTKTKSITKGGKKTNKQKNKTNKKRHKDNRKKRNY